MNDQDKSKAQLIAELEELREQLRSQKENREIAIQVEEELRVNDIRFRTIYESAPLLIDGFDERGRCILWNKECQRTFGWTMDEINSCDDPLSLFYPNPQVRDEVRKSVTSSPDREFREWHPLTKDGETRVCLWTNILLPDGTVMNLGQDLTEHKRVEEGLLRIEKLESIGILAGGIAHDLNNYLTVIVGNIGMAKMFADPAQKDKMLKIAEQGAMRLKDLT